MAIDTDISGWILEFVLRQRLDDKIVDALIQALPFPNGNSNLKRGLIIRKIESEISNGSVTEKILELLELFEELDHQEGIESSAVLKFAYCAVAVECTVKFLIKAGGMDKGEYFEAVRRIWKRRINVMEKMESVSFVSEEIQQWRDEIEAALWENRSRDSVIRRREDVDAVDAVNAFVREVKGRIGPSFLDVLAEAYLTDDRVKKLLGGVNIEGTPRSSDREVRVGNALPRRKHVAFKRSKNASVRTCGGVRISDSVESGLEASGGQDDLLPTPKIQGAIEALKLSSLELRAVVKDPLPSALKVAETLSSELKDNMGHHPAENNSASAPHPVAVSSRKAQANENTCDAQHKCHHNVASKLNLMERQSTAHTFEWDDSIDNSSEGSPSGARRFTLSSPKRIVGSSLRKYEFKKQPIKRKRMKWSALEEDTLRAGVKKYGAGNWKRILDANRDIFGLRTTVDLKDKWRNLIS